MHFIYKWLALQLLALFIVLGQSAILQSDCKFKYCYHHLINRSKALSYWPFTYTDATIDLKRHLREIFYWISLKQFSRCLHCGISLMQHISIINTTEHCSSPRAWEIAMRLSGVVWGCQWNEKDFELLNDFSFD